MLYIIKAQYSMSTDWGIYEFNSKDTMLGYSQKYSPNQGQFSQS